MKALLGISILMGIIALSLSGSTYIDVDMSKPSSEKRMCVISGSTQLYCTWVAHGRGSGSLYATSFSNDGGSNKSSLGNMRVGEKYYGKHGLSYRLIGLEKGVNDNVAARSIVIHSADYIGYGRTGRSQGCLAVPTRDYAQFLTYVKPGMIVNVHT